MSSSLWQVSGKRFTAAVYMLDDRIDDAAPILSWTLGKTREWLIQCAKRSGWVLHETVLESIPDEYRR